MSIENICNQYFNCNIAHIANYIMKYKTRFKNEYKYIDNDMNEQDISKNELFQIYLDRNKDSILNGMISVTDLESYQNFSKLVNLIIRAVISKRLEQGDNTLDTEEWHFSDSINNFQKKDLLYRFNSETKFVKPNTISSKMVIKWIVLYIISKNCHTIVKNGDSFDLEDIRDFEFQYNDKDDSLHLLVYTRRDYSIVKKWHFVHMYTSRRNVLDLDDWNEFNENNKPAINNVALFDSDLDSIVKEIKKFKDEYSTIHVLDAKSHHERESKNWFEEVYKIRVKEKSHWKSCTDSLEENEQLSQYKNFTIFSESLVKIINALGAANEIENNTDNYHFFISSYKDYKYDKISTDVSDEDNPKYSENTEYYYPSYLLQEPKIVISWLIVYKLCKHFDLDRSELNGVNISYYKHNQLLIFELTIGDKQHRFSIPYISKNHHHILNMNDWHNCTSCTNCVYIKEEESKMNEEPSENEIDRLVKLAYDQITKNPAVFGNVYEYNADINAPLIEVTGDIYRLFPVFHYDHKDHGDYKQDTLLSDLDLDNCLLNIIKKIESPNIYNYEYFYKSISTDEEDTIEEDELSEFHSPGFVPRIYSSMKAIQWFVWHTLARVNYWKDNSVANTEFMYDKQSDTLVIRRIEDDYDNSTHIYDIECHIDEDSVLSTRSWSMKNEQYVVKQIDGWAEINSLQSNSMNNTSIQSVVKKNNSKKKLLKMMILMQMMNQNK